MSQLTAVFFLADSKPEEDLERALNAIKKITADASSIYDGQKTAISAGGTPEILCGALEAAGFTVKLDQKSTTRTNALSNSGPVQHYKIF